MPRREFHKIENNCDFCGTPGALHEGGVEVNSITISGYFCNESCFNLWAKWKAVFIAKTRPKRMSNLEGENKVLKA